MKLGVLGAGAIGTHLGASHVLGGGTSVLVGRDRLLSCATSADASGVVLRAKKGHSRRLCTQVLNKHNEAQWHLKEGCLVTSDAAALRHCDAIFVCTKAQQVESAADTLRKALGDQLTTTPIVCCQNGFEAPEILRHKLEAEGATVDVWPLVVNFNVVWSGNTFVATTHEEVHAPAIPKLRAVYAALRLGGVRVVEHLPERMLAVQLAKTCTNLFNSINALSGLPVRETLLDEDFRALWIFAVQEALQVFRAGGTEPANIKVPVGLYSVLLACPTFLIRLVLASKLDATAKSSMLQDLEAGKTETEVDFLNLAVARLGAELDIPTPINSGLGQLVQGCAKHGKGSPHLSAKDVAKMLGLSDEALGYHRKQLARWVQLIVGCVLMNVVVVLAFL